MFKYILRIETLLASFHEIVYNSFKSAIREEMEGGINMKVLILYWGSASGSRSSALAMREQIMDNGDDCELLNCYTVASRKIPKKLLAAYQEIEKEEEPSDDGTLIRLQGIAKSTNYHYNFMKAAIKSVVYRHILEGRFDVVVVTHILPAEIVTTLKNDRQPMPPVVAVISEYGYAPGWEKTSCDRYVVADESLIAVYVKAGIRKGRLMPYGIPVRKDFAKKLNKRAARRRLHINPEGKIFLIMVGSKGVGEADNLLTELIGQCGHDDVIMVLCGSNRKAYCYLQEKYSTELSVIIREYTPHSNLFMDACDVVFTAPSGLISSEVAVKNVPLIHLRPLTACEVDNAEFFAERNMSVMKKTIAEKIREAISIASSPEKAEAMIVSQQNGINQEAAYDIYCLLKELAEEDRY